MEKFKVGDRVKVKSNATTINRRIVGQMGTIKGIVCGGCVVEFDKKVGGSSCGGLTKYGFGWLCTEEILSNVKNETIVIYRDDQKVITLDKSTGKKAEAKCNPADEFDFNVGAKLAFQRLMGEKSAADDAVREVKREAKVGDYIKIVDPDIVPLREDGKPYYKEGDVIKVTQIGSFGYPKLAEGHDKYDVAYIVAHSEYVVLENYKTKEESKKKDKICVGDTVKVVDRGKQFPAYSTWSGLEKYRQNFVSGSCVSTEYNYKVLAIKKHDNYNDRNIALIQNPKTTQVFIINIEGLSKVER